VNNRIVNILKYLLGWPFSILAFVFIIRTIAPQSASIIENIKNPDFLLLGLALACFLIFYFLRSVVWHLLLGVYKADIRYRTSAYFWAQSELKRYIPGNIWGFLARTFRFSGIGIEKKDIARLLLIEAGIFVMGMAIVSLLSITFVLDKVFPHLPDYLGKIALLVMLSGSVLYLYNYKINKLWEKFRPIDNLRLLLSASTAVLFFGAGYFFAISAIIPLPAELFFQLSGFFVLSFFIGALSLITPAGFGVREGFIIVGLSKILSTAAAGFAALFARFLLIVSELLFVLLAFLFYKSKNKFIKGAEKWIGHNKQEAILVIMFLIFTIYFALVSILRHDNFYTGRFDLGNMAQTVWNTTQGRIFEFTNPNGVEIVSRLAFHADFFLILLTPFYAVFPSPNTLLFIQALVVGAGCFFVYAIAKNILKNKNLALALSFSYLVNPSLERAIMYDFHAVTLATTFLLAAFYFYIKKKHNLLFLFLFLAAISKEQIWLVAAVFGALMFFQQKKRLLGSALSVSCLGVFYFLISYAIPNSAGSEHFALSYYSQFGSTPFEVIKNILSSPWQIISVLLEKEHIAYLKQLFLPVGYLPVFAPLYLILAAPDLMINLLSSNPQLHQIYYQYTAAITPFIFVSSIYSLRFLRKYLPKNSSIFLVFFIIISALIGAYRYGPLPGAKSPNLEMITKQAPNKTTIKNYLSNIPRELSVTAPNNIAAHLSHRERIYVFPRGIEQADVIIFNINKSDQSTEAEMQKELLETVKAGSEFRLDFEIDGFAVFIRKQI
jgi:uncharacterized membrane protein/uncharacterized membrane protein YbhN (UPF0104 family)